jgi:quercetin dioxygenase-like cupin family protein
MSARHWVAATGEPRYASSERTSTLGSRPPVLVVVSGAIRSENSATGPAKVYKAGETFVEPSGSEHLVSANASTTVPASMLVVFVADDGAQLTTFAK